MSYGHSVITPLRQTTLFSAYPEGDLQAIGRFSRLVSLPTAAVLFQEGEPCRAIYCVNEGLVRLFLHGPEHQEKTVEVVEPGQTFAEAAMFSGQGYPVTATAIEDSELVEVDAYSLMRYLHEHPELNWHMLSVLSRRLHQLVAHIRSVSLHNAEQKVASFLLQNFDPSEPDVPVAHLPPGRARLASLLGLTTETLCRVISSFRRRGWIATDDHSVLVRNEASLRGLLGGDPLGGP
jgi:CRP-like cAMP-binding protein